MQLLNYTNRPLLFVHTDNLVARGNHRFEIDRIENLDERLYLPVAGKPLRVEIEKVVGQLCFGLPVIREKIIRIDPMPDGDELLIVSKQYAEACRRLGLPLDRLRLVCGGVYISSVAFPVASTGICQVEPCQSVTQAVDYTIQQYPELKPVSSVVVMHQWKLDAIKEKIPEPQSTEKTDRITHGVLRTLWNKFLDLFS